MKINDSDKTPLMKRNKGRDNTGRPGLAARMREDGITHLTVNQVRDRMRMHDLTYEEALAYQPMTPHEKGRIGRKRSRWGRWVSDEEFQAKKEAEKTIPSFRPNNAPEE